MSATDSDRKKRLLEIASYLERPGKCPQPDFAAFLRDLAEHGWSGEMDEDGAEVEAAARVFYELGDGVNPDWRQREFVCKALRAAFPTQPGSGEGEECEWCKRLEKAGEQLAVEARVRLQSVTGDDPDHSAWACTCRQSRPP
jgi:hypothetical protein